MEYSNEKFRSEFSTRSNFTRSREALNKYKLSRKRKGTSAFKLIAMILIVIVISAIAVYGILKLISNNREKKETEAFSNAQMKQDIYIDFSILGMNKPLAIKGMTKQEVYDAVLGTYDFDMKVRNSNPEIDIFAMPKYGEEVVDTDLSKYMEGQSEDDLGTSQEVTVTNPLSDITIKADKDIFKLPDFIEGQIKKKIDDIYDKYLYVSTNEFSKKKVDVDSPDFVADFIFKVEDNDSYLDSLLSQISRLWDTKASKGQIESFDEKKNEFTFGDDHKGYVIDQDELRKRILEEVNKGNLKTELWTVLTTVDADGASVKSRYKYVSVFETWTTDNEKRNKNINLACRGINGTIVKPGQEFSFNNKLGERTEEKGYDYAPAYLEGQVVEELGGGVCQVSTTLYNAIFGAGLTTTYRKSHTFEPAYITPGLDATVSYHGPDYRFINNSDYSVGIRATYAKQKVKIEIFAVPLLKNGQTQNLVSKKIQDLEMPTISIINEGHASKGTQGSEWQVFKIVKEGDKEIDRVHDHYAKYQGHTPTAFEEYTYIDDDGIIQTSKFVETRKEETTKKKNTSITTARRENVIQNIAPSENSRGNVVEIAPGGGSSTGQPQ